MKLYLAGPMTGIKDLNFPAFHAAAAQLRALGHEVVNPAEVNSDTTMAWADCMRLDIAELVKCQGIALMPGWGKSKGAKLEQHIAEQLGMAEVHLLAESCSQGLADALAIAGMMAVKTTLPSPAREPLAGAPA